MSTYAVLPFSPCPIDSEAVTRKWKLGLGIDFAHTVQLYKI